MQNKKTAAVDDLSCIESIKYKKTTGKASGIEREVKLAPKLKALELLGKHLGMWNDKLDVNVAVPIVISGEISLRTKTKAGIGSQYVFDYQKRILHPEIYKTTSKRKTEIRLPDIVGKGYGTFWNWKGRYRVCKGSRASKKSKTMALWVIVNMMKYPDANTLVVRKVFGTLKDSCFTELKWAIHRLGVDDFWKIRESPLEMTYSPTGQKIYFRGLDDPLKVTSITVKHGYLCFMWLEEAYEVGNEADFDMLNESIRGAIPEETGLFKQVTLTLNP